MTPTLVDTGPASRKSSCKVHQNTPATAIGIGTIRAVREGSTSTTGSSLREVRKTPDRCFRRSYSFKALLSVFAVADNETRQKRRSPTSGLPRWQGWDLAAMRRERQPSKGSPNRIVCSAATFTACLTSFAPAPRGMWNIGPDVALGRNGVRMEDHRWTGTEWKEIGRK